MQNQEDISKFYNQVALAYSERWGNELGHKHFDRMLLRSFADQCRGKVLDIGCGPGQTTRFLKDLGVEDILGLDLSTGMIRQASTTHRDITFQVGNMLELEFNDGEIDHALCFYGIVHFTLEQLSGALLEINRALRPGGNLLFSFHIGNEIVHLNEFLEKSVDIDFLLHEKATIVDLCLTCGYELVDVIERDPYTEIESPTQRAYVWVRK